MPAIKSLNAKEILDSRGNPTIQVTLWLDDNQAVETSVPNGIKHHPNEAFVLHDQDLEHRGGQGVQKAVALINQTIAPQLIGQDPTQQAQIDQLLKQLDGTPQKTQAGANTLIALSQAVLKAGALAVGQPLYQYMIQQFQLTDHVAIPTCLYGLVNGGQYGSDNLDIQEFLVIPASHVDFRVSLEIESVLRTKLQEILKSQKANYSFGELGGFTPYLQKNTDVFEFILEAARKTSYILARDFFFGIDAGGENLLNGGKYVLKDKSTGFSEKELLEYYKNLRERYNLTYFEDPFAVKDINSWQSLTTDLADTTRIAGDIITATQPALVQKAIANHYCNTLVVKPSQVGTITETLQAIQLARNAGWAIVVSQRTGETNDDFLADFAVGVGAEFVKFGPTNRGEAVSKYNRLADIYKEIEHTTQEGNTMTEPTQPTNAGATAPTPAEPATMPTPPAPAVDPMASGVPQNKSIPVVEPPVPPMPAPPEPAVEKPAASTPPAASPSNLPPPTMPPATPTMPASTPPVTPTEKPMEADMQKAIDNTLAEIGAKSPAAPAAPAAPTTPAEPAASAPPAQE